MTADPRKQVGKYQLVDVLGEGAMGVVYRAFDQVLNRYLAIKVMNAAIGNNPQLRERFLREARAAGSLQHPNVVTIYDFGETDEVLFIAMEFVEGEDLTDLIKRRAEVPIETKLDLMVDTLSGLAYAHNRGVVHRDIKPGNIRVTADGRAKLMDFGIAYLQSSELTQTGVLIGTPQYMAPEQVSGGAITASADVFAAGAVLYELLTYRKPFDGDTLHVIFNNILNLEPPPVSSVVPNATAAVERIVSKALTKDPAERFESAVAMSEALQAARRSLAPVSDATTTTVRAASLPYRNSQIQGMITAEVSRHRRRWVLVAGGVAVPALALTLWLAPWKRGAEGTTTSDAQASAPVADSLPGASAGSPNVPTTPPANDGAAAPRGTTAAPVQRPRDAGQSIPQGRATVPPAVATAPPVTADPGANARADSVLFQSSRTMAMNARRSASEQGATQADLAAGDSALRAADRAIADGRTTDAVAQLSDASSLWNDGARAARARAAAAVVASAPPPVASPPPATRSETLPRPPADPRPDIERAIADYATAIQSRNVADIRRAYPGLTSQQQQQWDGFYRIARNFRATLRIENLSVTGAAAAAAIGTIYEFENSSNGRAERQEFRMQAQFARSADGRWRIESIR